jgi:hypothetical protein
MVIIDALFSSIAITNGYGFASIQAIIACPRVRMAPKDPLTATMVLPELRNPASTLSKERVDGSKQSSGSTMVCRHGSFRGPDGSNRSIDACKRSIVSFHGLS